MGIDKAGIPRDGAVEGRSPRAAHIETTPRRVSHPRTGITNTVILRGGEGDFPIASDVFNIAGYGSRHVVRSEHSRDSRRVSPARPGLLYPGGRAFAFLEKASRRARINGRVPPCAKKEREGENERQIPQ